jgi:hypothetical protein
MRSSAQLTVIYWRDIPAQVTAADGVRTARVELPARFMGAIDAAATTAGLVGSDAYLEEWRRVIRDCGANLEREVAAEAERLEAAHPPDVLAILVESGGVGKPEDP